MKKYLLVISVILYVMCLFFPAILAGEIDKFEQKVQSFDFLLFGWINVAGIFASLMSDLPTDTSFLIVLWRITWLANPLYFSSPIFAAYRRYWTSIILVVLALFLVASYAFTTDCYCHPDYTLYLISLITGYWLWLASMLMLLIASCHQVFQKRRA